MGDNLSGPFSIFDKMQACLRLTGRAALLFVFLCALLVAADPTQANNLLRHGLLALQCNQLGTARQDLEAAAKANPENAYVWTSLAQTYWRLKEPAKATASAEKAAKLEAGNPKIAHALAMFYTEAQQFNTAAAFEQQYADSGTADPEATGRAADLYLNAGEPAQALECARRANDLNHTAVTQDLLGRALIANNNISEGLQNLAEASKSSPNNETISFDYAQALFHQGEFSTAIQVLKPALEAHPKNVQLELAYGVACYGQRRFEDAIDAFLKTIAIDPSIPQPYEFLGKILDQAGARLPEITKDYQAWYSAAHRQYRPSFLLAKALLASDPNAKNAEQYLRESIRLKPDYWESRFELGQLLEKRHNYKEAAVELQQSIKLEKNEPMPHYHLARVYDRLGEPEKAKTEREEHARLLAQRKDTSSSGMVDEPRQ